MRYVYLEKVPDLASRNALELAEVCEDEAHLLEVDGAGTIRVIPVIVTEEVAHTHTPDQP